MNWAPTILGDILVPIDRKEKVWPTHKYQLLGMRSKIAGPFLREIKFGNEISATKLNRVEEGDFIYSRLFAWQGSFGVIPADLSGCYVSNEFPIFQVASEKINRRFLTYWFGLTTTQATVETDCYGSTPGTRNRYKEEFFYELEIPLPPLDKQNGIVARLDKIRLQLLERKNAGEEMGRDAEAMLFNAFKEVIEGAEYYPVEKVAPQVRRPISVDIDGEYPELGVRSFGKGTFHKPTLSGADVGSKRIYQFKEGDLVFSNVFSWEGAIAVAKPEDDARVGSHRFITCVPEPDTTTSEFLRYYFLTPEGLAKIGTASPGGAGRNRTLGLKKLEKLLVPIPNIEKQRWFDELCAKVHEMEEIRVAANKVADALIPAMLHEIFEHQKVVPVQVEEPRGSVIAFPDVLLTKIDTSFKEAVLVGAIIKAFHNDGGQPLGNFRLQKGVYFARRFMGETALEQEFLRKAAGPYNPSMRYSGGFSIALKKNWIGPRIGNYGKGHAPGKSASEMDEWIEKYQLAKPVAWVHDKFKFRKNDQWELLATIDYAILALNAQDTNPSPINILEYICNDKEWHPKIEKLRLSEATVQNAMVELQTLFMDVEAK